MIPTPKILFGFRSFLGTILLSGFLVSLGSTMAQQGDSLPQTTSDRAINLKALALQATPLEKEELLVELEAWQELLKAEAKAIAALEIQELSVTPEGKKALLDSLNQKRIERTQVADRMIVIMNAYQTKGGDITPYRSYISSVTGIQFNIKELGKSSSRLWSWATSEEGGLRWAGNLAWAAIALLAFRFAARGLGNLLEKALDRAADNSSEILRDFLVNALRKVVFFIGIIVALDALGVQSGPFLAAFGAVGFILGFALQGTLSNLAAGLMILFHRPYDIGHFVTASGVTGKVTSMNLASTTFLTGDNQVVIVPNGSIWGSVITNITGSETRRVDMTFSVDYGDDMEKAEELITEIVLQHPLVLKDPEPTIRVNELADSSVNIICRPWAKTSDYWTVHWDILKSVKKRFDAEGISIPFPQQDIRIHHIKEP